MHALKRGKSELFWLAFAGVLVIGGGGFGFLWLLVVFWSVVSLVLWLAGNVYVGVRSSLSTASTRRRAARAQRRVRGHG